MSRSARSSAAPTRTNSRRGERRAVRNVPRGRYHRTQPQLGRIFLRSALVYFGTILIVFAWLWWHIPRENPVTGERENYGTLFTRGVQSIVNPKKSFNVVFQQPRFSVLLVGLDHVPATKGDPGIIRRSDSVMVATTDYDTKQVRLLSIPRDGWVMHWQGDRNYGYERLASTYSLGQQTNLNDPLAGIQRTKESVAKLLDIKIDYYVVIEFEGLAKLVDALGGLEIDVPMDMNYDDKAAALHIHFKKGRQHLNGEQVVQYARFRDKKLADLGRMPRQQEVVKLILQEMMKASNLAKLPELARIMHESVLTNFSLDELIALAQHIDEYSPDCIQNRTIDNYWSLEPGQEIDLPGLAEGQPNPGAQWIYQRDRDRAREFLLDLAAPIPEPETMTAESGAGA